jgi:hypothetical protein
MHHGLRSVHPFERTARRKTDMQKQCKAYSGRVRAWVVQVALLCFIGFHSLGLLHQHKSLAEHDACAACQLFDHQASNMPDAESRLPLTLLVLLFVLLPWHLSAAPALLLFARPRTRAPPFATVAGAR